MEYKSTHFGDMIDLCPMCTCIYFYRRNVNSWMLMTTICNPYHQTQTLTGNKNCQLIMKT